MITQSDMNAVLNDMVTDLARQGATEAEILGALEDAISDAPHIIAAVHAEILREAYEDAMDSIAHDARLP